MKPRPTEEVGGEQVKTSQCDVFFEAKEPKQGVLRVNYSLSKTTMRREWGVVRTRNVNQLDEIRENKECRANALVCARDDYIFDCAMKNPTPATIKRKAVQTDCFSFYVY